MTLSAVFPQRLVDCPWPARNGCADAGVQAAADGDGRERWWLTLAPTQPAPGLIVVRVRGELDAATAGRCCALLRAAVLAVAREIARGRATGSSGSRSGRVVCDLDGVGFLSASGLGAFLEVDQHARAHGVELVLVATTRPVLRVLTLTGLDRQLTLERTLQTANAAPITAASAS